MKPSALRRRVAGVFGALLLTAPAFAAQDPPAAGGRTLRPVTPLMGYAAAPGVNAQGVLALADTLQASGLAAAGYRFVTLPADTVAGRDASGTLQADAQRFPAGLKPVASALRARGFTPGLRVAASPTDAGLESVRSDVTRLLRGWDLGLLRFDVTPPGPETEKRFTPLAREVRRVRPDAVLMLDAGAYPGGWIIGLADAWCVAPPPPPGPDPFSRVLAALDASRDAWRTAYPGRTPGLGPLRFEGLSPEQRRTHFALWCMLASPLFLTGDPAAYDADTLGLLTHPGLLAVSQDPLVQPARRLGTRGGLELWARPLGDGLHSGRLAVAVLNRGPAAGSARLNPAALGLDPSTPIEATPIVNDAALTAGPGGSITFTLMPHATVLILLEGTAVPESPFAR